jgi:Na+-transporting NADH:ubiquinone oxidoreductase subunit NqrE
LIRLIGLIGLIRQIVNAIHIVHFVHGHISPFIGKWIVEFIRHIGIIGHIVRFVNGLVDRFISAVDLFIGCYLVIIGHYVIGDGVAVRFRLDIGQDLLFGKPFLDIGDQLIGTDGVGIITAAGIGTGVLLG